MPASEVDTPPATRTPQTPTGPERPATYRDVFAGREFRAVFAADLCSLAGDQIAAVAVAVLLYGSSGSPLLAALGYATAYVPWLVGGPLLSAWAERFAGRRVLVGCDLARAALIGAAALPGLPVGVVALLVLAAAMLAPPFDAARSALLPRILPGDRYPVAMSLRDAVHQGAQLVGFGVGGALVVAVSARGALAVDAVTFALSAAVLRLGVRMRPPVRVPAGAAGTSLWRETLEGLGVLRADPVLRSTLAFGVVGAAYAIVPEAIAPVYAESVGAGPAAVGLIMAAVAGGSVVGGLAMGRLVPPARRSALIRPLALAGTLPLGLVALRPGLVTSLALFAVTGLVSSYQVAANALFARRVPEHARARAFGLAITALNGGQALAVVLAGAAAQFAPPAAVVAGAGLLGALVLLRLPAPPTLPR